MKKKLISFAFGLKVDETAFKLKLFYDENALILSTYCMFIPWSI